MARWTRVPKAELEARIRGLLGKGLGVKQIAARLVKSESRIHTVMQGMCRKTICKGCGRPLDFAIEGRTVPCENVKPAES